VHALNPLCPYVEHLHITSRFFAAGCVDEEICKLAEAVRKHLNSSNGLNAMAGITGTGTEKLITETTQKQSYDICNGV